MEKVNKILLLVLSIAVAVNVFSLIYIVFIHPKAQPVIVNEDCSRAHIHLNAGSYNSIYVDSEGNLLGKTEARIEK